MKIGNKWAKHEALKKDVALRRHVPEARRMSRNSLASMLKKYRMVYVKPLNGSRGVGVMKVEAVGSGLRLHDGVRARTFSDFTAGYAAVLRAAKGKPYLVQRGIGLSRYGGRPFDIRVVVQRLPKGQWTVTGWVGRVARQGKIVTNGSQGGAIYPVDRLLSGSVPLVNRMKRIGLQTARRLHRYYPGLVEIGLDLAVDRSRRLWILEANTSPDPCPFTKLPDRRMLQRIIRYGGAWGIRYKLHCMKARRGITASTQKTRSRRA